MMIKRKINLYTSVMFICLLIIINSAIYFTFSKMLYESELDRTYSEVIRVAKGVNLGSNQIPMNDLLRAYAPIDGMLQIVNSDSKRNGAVTSPGHEYLIEQPITFFGKENRKIVKYNEIPHTFVSIPMVWENGEIVSLQVTQNLETTAQNLKTLSYVLIIVTILAALPVLLSTHLLSKFITRPITTMTTTMSDIRGSGKFKMLDLPKKSNDELYQMGETFNEMMGQLENNYEKQEQFVSNASHELKTPLTVIESYASLLKRRGMEQPELFHESVDAIHSEAIRMRELTEQLLNLARNDQQWSLNKEDISLADLVKDSVRSFTNAFNREIELTIDHNPVIHTDGQKLKQLLYIFLDNARKYSEDKIMVSIKLVDESAVVAITDKGIGIPAADLPKVFNRLYRVDKARTRKSGGFGLGLSLAKEIADAIDAHIKLESIEGLGTTATISFGLVKSH